MTENRVLVIGSTGKVGGAVVTALLGRGARVRALARTPDAARLPESVEVVGGSLTDSASLTAALSGVDAVFLVWPFLSAEGITEVLNVVGERRLVYLSSLGVGDSLVRQRDPINQFHAHVERAIVASTARWTMLRAGTFAANALGWAEQVRGGDAVREAHGAATRAVVHERDLAEVAARVLTEPGHDGARYELTGPEGVSQIDQVRIIGEVLGREVRFEELSDDDARREMIDLGWPVEFAEGMLGAWDGFERDPVVVSGTVAKLTGAAPRSFRDWVHDHATAFR